ncbi:unnamed protein product [Leptidea sinapis]|uniref:Fibroin light chain n=1 Tax=Leptidea sinapis TaxID=189913 RepID=A0A5E4PVG7_9NEOP|nr:unnamed protein product [Leptidea sinapis]
MLPFLLVLIAAQSALAAPSASVSFYNANQIDSPVDNGNLVNRYVISGPFDYLDVSDIPLYSNMMLQILGDLSIVPDSVAQTSAVIQAIATLGELTNGIPGDSCEAAGLINAFAYASSSGNNAGLAQALANFVQRLSNNIDSITQLIVNPSSARYSAGPRGNCLGGGRTYQFEEAWDAILSNSSPAASSRMYNAFNIRSNNVGAAVTATNIPQVVQVAQYAVQYLTNFLRVVASGSNPSQAGAAAKSALAQGLAKVKC